MITQAMLLFFSFAISSVGLWLLIRSGFAMRLAMDLPNHRSLHVQPTPRVGGLILVPAFLLGWLVLPLGLLLPALVVVLATLSYLDDRFGLPVVLRFLAQLVAALLFAISNRDTMTTVAITLVAVLWIVWCANLYNFMDGADGLAGGMAFFGFATLGAAASIYEQQSFSLASLCVAMAALGFLVFNFPPAKIFMGDVGSIPLGFLMGAMGLEGQHIGLWPLWFPILVFSPFVVDATATLAKRVAKREKIWIAHRDHYYQRLVRMGWSHRQLALLEYALMVACGVSALVLLRCSREIQFAGLAAWAVIYVVLMIKIDSCWKTFSATPR